MNRSACSSLALAAALAAQAPPPAPPIPTSPLVATAPATATTRPIDLAICLDISGSMDGLINQARQNLWSVVNDLATLKPAPTLRVALLTYGCTSHDAERGWVKVETDFTTDLDLVSQKLFALTTNGGEEYVARVVRTAVEQLQWSPDAAGLKLLFVAGNEAATQDPLHKPEDAGKLAIGRGIVVNSIYCGSPTDELAPAWRQVAKCADGQFAAIEKDNAVVITTPFDEQLAALSAAMNPTYVPYGAQRGAWAENQVAQDSNATNLNSAAAAQRCQTKASAFYLNAQWDLVDACEDAKFKLEDVKKDDLPEALRTLTLEQLRAHIAGKKQERAAIRAKVEDLGKQRDAFVRGELKKLGEKGDAVFEKAVLEAVRLQAEARGFKRAAPAAPVAPATPPAKASDVDSSFTQLIEDAARDYRSFVCVTDQAKRAPADCRMAAPVVRRSDAAKEHGQKLYLLYARFADGKDYVKAGQVEKVGQTLVKEAWQCVEGEPSAPTEAGKRYLVTPRFRDGDKTFHAGDAAGLFVMHKLAADTSHTDQGWVYGTVDRDGVVTAAGRVASCMRCHEGAAEDRRFGLR